MFERSPCPDVNPKPDHITALFPKDSGHALRILVDLDNLGSTTEKPVAIVEVPGSTFKQFAVFEWRDDLILEADGTTVSVKIDPDTFEASGRQPPLVADLGVVTGRDDMRKISPGAIGTRFRLGVTELSGAPVLSGVKDEPSSEYQWPNEQGQNGHYQFVADRAVIKGKGISKSVTLRNRQGPGSKQIVLASSSTDHVLDASIYNLPQALPSTYCMIPHFLTYYGLAVNHGQLHRNFYKYPPKCRATDEAIKPVLCAICQGCG